MDGLITQLFSKFVNLSFLRKSNCLISYFSQLFSAQNACFSPSWKNIDPRHCGWTRCSPPPDTPRPPAPPARPPTFTPPRGWPRGSLSAPPPQPPLRPPCYPPRPSPRRHRSLIIASLHLYRSQASPAWHPLSTRIPVFRIQFSSRPSPFTRTRK